MWFGKKEEKKVVTPERMLEVSYELKRLVEARDEEGFLKFCIAHYEELPRNDRYAATEPIYEELRQRIGQEEAEQWVADRLHLFNSEDRDEIKKEIWGSVIEDLYAKKKWKTGRSDRPYNVEEWMDPKVNPKAKKPKK